MARMEDLPPEVKTFVQMYAWQRIDPVPWTKVRKPLADSRIGLVVTACMTMPGQEPFHADQPGNDPSVRVISSVAPPSALVNTYSTQAFDHAGLQADANLLVPLDRLREMAVVSEIGELAPRTVSLCGHLPKPRVLMDETAPGIARLFVDECVDAVLLVPA
jgi:D-proline reductase (dithiol) PrdB